MIYLSFLMCYALFEGLMFLFFPNFWRKMFAEMMIPTNSNVPIKGAFLIMLGFLIISRVNLPDDLTLNNYLIGMLAGLVAIPSIFVGVTYLFFGQEQRSNMIGLLNSYKPGQIRYFGLSEFSVGVVGLGVTLPFVF